MYCASLVDISPVVGKNDFLNFVNVFLLFGNYLPLEEDRALYLNKLESSSPKLCEVLVEIGPMVHEKKIF